MEAELVFSNMAFSDAIFLPVESVDFIVSLFSSTRVCCWGAERCGGGKRCGGAERCGGGERTGGGVIGFGAEGWKVRVGADLIFDVAGAGGGERGAYE